MGLLGFLDNIFSAKKGAKIRPGKTKRAKPAVRRSQKPPRKKPPKTPAQKARKIVRAKPPALTQPKTPPKKPKEKEIGVITHYFGKISVGIIKLKTGLKVGDRIHVLGAHNDFVQTVQSMQINHKDVSRAGKGAEVGIKVARPVHENDRAYLSTAG